MSSAADRWDSVYAEADEPGGPADFVLEWADLLPRGGAAVDLAGGTGGTALWLAERGFDATLVEVSERAIDVACRAAGQRGIELSTVLHDLESDNPLVGSWDVAVVSNFLYRPLLGRLHELLNPGGLALVRVATVRNLERNERPGARFLVEEDELPGLCAGLEVVRFDQGWFDGRREARLAGRVSGPTRGRPRRSGARSGR